MGMPLPIGRFKSDYEIYRWQLSPSYIFRNLFHFWSFLSKLMRFFVLVYASQWWCSTYISDLHKLTGWRRGWSGSSFTSCRGYFSWSDHSTNSTRRGKITFKMKNLTTINFFVPKKPLWTHLVHLLAVILFSLQVFTCISLLENSMTLIYGSRICAWLGNLL